LEIRSNNMFVGRLKYTEENAWLVGAAVGGRHR
jgi:hypothetical protein